MGWYMCMLNLALYAYVCIWGGGGCMHMEWSVCIHPCPLSHVHIQTFKHILIKKLVLISHTQTHIHKHTYVYRYIHEHAVYIYATYTHQNGVF